MINSDSIFHAEQDAMRYNDQFYCHFSTYSAGGKNMGPCILEVTVGLWWKILVSVSEMTKIPFSPC